MTWKTLLELLTDWFQQRNWHTRPANYVIGVSGGLDSVLLLRAIATIRRRDKLDWKINVAHLHHGMRGTDADEDARFVKNLADELGLPAHIERIQPDPTIETPKATEEWARERRYEFLERVALQVAAEHVLVAHHADDNIETILHRICRGTGLRGLAGIHHERALLPGSRVRLCRPLLQCRRADLAEVCREEAFPFRHDSTNDTDQFTRGRIRNNVLPVLREQLNPLVDEALLRLGEHAARLGNYLADVAAHTFDSLVVSEEPGLLVLNRAALARKHTAIQSEILRRAISLVAAGEQDLSYAHVESILRLVESAETGKEVHLPRQIAVQRQYDRLIVRRAPREDQPTPLGTTFIRCPGHTPLPALAANLTAELHNITRQQVAEIRRAQRNGEEWIDYDRLALPLYVRNRRDGDRFQPLGAPGAKTLSDFFIDEKIDRDLRDRVGILCDQNGPIWVMPMRIHERVKLSQASRKALKLTLEPIKSARPD